LFSWFPSETEGERGRRGSSEKRKERRDKIQNGKSISVQF